MSLQGVICITPIIAFQELSQLALVGYAWDMSQLDKLRLSGLIEAYRAAAD